MSLLYEWRKTLLAPVLLHAFVNSVGLAFIAWGIAVNGPAPRLGLGGESHEGGCVVTVVVPGSGAEAAGLAVGDVVHCDHGAPIRDLRSMTQAVRRRHVGDTVVVEFLRGGEAHRVEAVLKE